MELNLILPYKPLMSTQDLSENRTGFSDFSAIF